LFIVGRVKKNKTFFDPNVMTFCQDILWEGQLTFKKLKNGRKETHKII